MLSNFADRFYRSIGIGGVFSSSEEEGGRRSWEWIFRVFKASLSGIPTFQISSPLSDASLLLRKIAESFCMRARARVVFDIHRINLSRNGIVAENIKFPIPDGNEIHCAARDLYSGV